MKKIIVLVIFSFFLYGLVNAQSIYFNKRIDVFGDWEVSRGIITLGNGYLVAGGKGPGNKIYLSNLDSVGNIKWSQIYTEIGYNYFFGLSGSLFPTTDKYFAICGGRVPQPKGYGILIKVDSLGNRKWEKEYLLADVNNNFNSGNITKDSGYILTGYANYGSTRQSYLLLKTDSLGNQQWFKTFTDNNPNRNYAGKSVIQTPDKGYCIGGSGGYWHVPGTEYRSIIEIIKTDSLGNQQWKKTYGNPIYNNNGSMLCLSKDSCIFATYSSAFSSGEYDNRQVFVTKLGLDGVEKWNKRIGLFIPGNCTTWILTLNDGSFVISGGHRVKDTIFRYVGWLFKLDKNGDSLWYKEYSVIQGSEDENQLWHFSTTPDKGFACAGSLFPEVGNGGQDIWVFKTDSLGCLFPNCNGVGNTEFTPHAGAQMLVYPNPFTNAFAINYSIPKESKKAVFELRDIFGKLIYQTVLSNNVNQLQVVASSLEAGVYFGSLVVDGSLVKTEKIEKL